MRCAAAPASWAVFVGGQNGGEGANPCPPNVFVTSSRWGEMGQWGGMGHESYYKWLL